MKCSTGMDSFHFTTITLFGKSVTLVRLENRSSLICHWRRRSSSLHPHDSFIRHLRDRKKARRGDKYLSSLRETHLCPLRCHKQLTKLREGQDVCVLMNLEVSCISSRADMDQKNKLMRVAVGCPVAAHKIH